MLSIKNIRTLTDTQYLNALDIEDDIVNPLVRAQYTLYDVSAQVDPHYEVDIPEQKEYIVTQIDDMIYQLNEIKNKLEG